MEDLKAFEGLVYSEVEVLRAMKVAVGRPGTLSGLLLRIGQSLFAASSIAFMVSAFGFSNYTAFWYAIVSRLLLLLLLFI